MEILTVSTYKNAGDGSISTIDLMGHFFQVRCPNHYYGRYIISSMTFDDLLLLDTIP